MLLNRFFLLFNSTDEKLVWAHKRKKEPTKRRYELNLYGLKLMSDRKYFGKPILFNV